jgi:phage shock protein PspC (stress-responsive transcriptional regulator)
MSSTVDQIGREGRTPLRRAQDGRTFGGVAAGFATFFALDVARVRIAFVVLAILGGASLPLYFAAWAFIPEEGSDQAIADRFLRHAGVVPS